MDNPLASRLRRLRETRGESLSAAARPSGITKQSLSLLEIGRKDNPTLRTLRGLANHYGVSVGYLVGE